ncbi:anaphase-promoting complex subunit 4 WD40 domain-containing protein [Ditylenchus destructor]|uniref:Anaphase-promoting complex subunit 4 WD40 domain-containing protein n=1 Tax=Ditylenchus destructor TaxID=166010 RepID=A0AAD4N0C0_9BILA|nr:anaphase-promoting complex subunit 4 WD40 domain-containing protein [Ditylenchus destructor]
MGNFCHIPLKREYELGTNCSTTKWKKKSLFSSKKKAYADPQSLYNGEAEKTHTGANIKRNRENSTISSTANENLEDCNSTVPLNCSANVARNQGISSTSKAKKNLEDCNSTVPLNNSTDIERNHGISSISSKNTHNLADCNSTVPLNSSSKQQSFTAQKENISGNKSMMQDSRSFHTMPTETILVSPENCNGFYGNQSTVISLQSIALDSTQDDDVLMSELSLGSLEIEESGNINGQYSPENLTAQSGRITPMPTPLRKFDALSPGRELELFRIDGKPAYNNKNVALAEWNPKMNLLVLASRRGDLVVKRSSWKTGWKRNFRKDADQKLWYDLCMSSSSGSIANICWSPDGEVLLVLFEDGKIYFLDAQTGRTIFCTFHSFRPSMMRWFKISTSGSSHDSSPSVQRLISSKDFNFNSRISQDYGAIVGDIEEFCSKALPNSLHGTYLCFAYQSEENENTYVDILSCGVFPIFRLNVTEALLSNAKEVEVYSSTIEVLDILLLNKEQRIQVLCKYNVRLKNTASSNIESEFRWNTDILNFDIECSDEALHVHSKISDSVCWMTFCATYIREMFSYVTNDWKAQSAAFHQRLLSSMYQDNVFCESSISNFRRDFFQVLTTGVLPTSLQITESTAKDMKLANGFVDDFFPVLLIGIHSGLQPAVHMFRQYLDIVESSIQKLSRLQQKDAYNSSLLSTLEMISRSNYSTSFTSKKQEDLPDYCFEEIHGLRLSLFVFEQQLWDMAQACESNRKSLKHLLRWLCSFCIHNETDHRLLCEKQFVDKADVQNFIHLIQSISLPQLPDDTSVYSELQTHSDIAYLDNWLDRIKNINKEAESSLVEFPTKMEVTDSDKQDQKSIRLAFLDNVLPFLESDDRVEERHRFIKEPGFFSNLDSDNPKFSTQERNKILGECSCLQASMEMNLKLLRNLLRTGTSKATPATVPVISVEFATLHSFSNAFLINCEKDERTMLDKRVQGIPYSLRTAILAHIEEDKSLRIYAIGGTNEIKYVSKNSFTGKTRERSISPRKRAKSSNDSIINELIHGESHDIHHILPSSDSHFIGLLSLRGNKFSDRVYAFKASLDDGKVSVDLNSDIPHDISLIRISPNGNLMCVVDSSKTRITWLELEDTQLSNNYPLDDSEDVKPNNESDIPFSTENQENINTPLMYKRR